MLVLSCCGSNVVLSQQTEDPDGKKIRRITFDQPGNDVTGMIIRSEKIAGACETVRKRFRSH